ncbi:MAG: hypothetical protein U1E17_05995 [Geminicoccaceae bacterium]
MRDHLTLQCQHRAAEAAHVASGITRLGGWLSHWASVVCRLVHQRKRPSRRMAQPSTSQIGASTQVMLRWASMRSTSASIVAATCQSFGLLGTGAAGGCRGRRIEQGDAVHPCPVLDVDALDIGCPGRR